MALGWTLLHHVDYGSVFVFPPNLPVSGSNMSTFLSYTAGACLMNIDYCIAVFAIVVIISVFQWIVDGRKNFTGPRVNLTGDAVEAYVGEQHGEVEEK